MQFQVTDDRAAGTDNIASEAAFPTMERNLVMQSIRVGRDTAIVVIFQVVFWTGMLLRRWNY